jgi:hypothetical protein
MAATSGPKTAEKHSAKTQDVIDKVKRSGKVTYDELEQILPENATAEEIDEVMVALSDTDVEVVDEFKIDAERKEARRRRLAKLRSAQGGAPQGSRRHSRLERADDPVRMYLREMGRVPLLTKDQEVAIAKRIEAAENELNGRPAQHAVHGQGSADDRRAHPCGPAELRPDHRFRRPPRAAPLREGTAHPDGEDRRAWTLQIENAGKAPAPQGPVGQGRDRSWRRRSKLARSADSSIRSSS